jgi:hypothetical protein
MACGIISKYLARKARQSILGIMLKHTINVPNIKWFEFVTGVSEPEFMKRRSELVQPNHDQSSNLLHGINIGPPLQIRSVNV